MRSTMLRIAGMQAINDGEFDRNPLRAQGRTRRDLESDGLCFATGHIVVAGASAPSPGKAFARRFPVLTWTDGAHPHHRAAAADRSAHRHLRAPARADQRERLLLR